MRHQTHRQAVIDSMEEHDSADHYTEYLIRLTDRDKRDIGRYVFEQFKREMFVDAGKGLLNWVWKMFLAGMFILAGYGASHGWFK